MENAKLDDFREELSPRKADGKWGYVGKGGEWAIEPRFEDVFEVLNGRAWVKAGSKWGCLNLVGKWVIEPAYDDVWCWNDDDEGIIHVRVGAKFGCIDTAGRWVIRPTFDDLTWFHEGTAIALVGRKWGAIDVTGSWRLKPEWDDIEILDANRLRAREGSLDSEWRYFDCSGSEIVETT